MTIVQTDESERPVPALSGGKAHAELIESAAGWSLILQIDAEVLNAISHGLPLSNAEITVSVSPNLVPGEAFAISSVRLVPSA